MTILTSRLSVGNLMLKNRLVMPPMAVPKSTDDGLVTDALCDYYADKSNGGFLGLVITEHCYISPEGKAHSGQLSIAEEHVIPGLTKLVNTIHANNTPVFAQLSHAGGRTHFGITGMEGIAPSAVVLPNTKAEVPVAREMTLEDIRKTVDNFAKAAQRAKRAGYDGVELHSAHGYLLNQFFSPLGNYRDDDYTGTTLEGRLRLHLEILKAVREEVGDDYPIAVRLASCDCQEGGITKEDAVLAAKELERAGADLLDISGGFNGYLRPGHAEPGYYRELSHAIKEAVRIPVILTGGIQSGQDAETLLKDGMADLIGVGRAILKNSAWARDAVLVAERI